MFTFGIIFGIIYLSISKGEKQMDIIARIAEELRIKVTQAEAAVKLIDEGNTIPFIARYRKEATGSLDDTVLRDLDEKLRAYRRGHGGRCDAEALL